MIILFIHSFAKMVHSFLPYCARDWLDDQEFIKYRHQLQCINSPACFGGIWYLPNTWEVGRTPPNFSHVKMRLYYMETRYILYFTHLGLFTFLFIYLRMFLVSLNLFTCILSLFRFSLMWVCRNCICVCLSFSIVPPWRQAPESDRFVAETHPEAVQEATGQPSLGGHDSELHRRCLPSPWGAGRDNQIHKTGAGDARETSGQGPPGHYALPLSTGKGLQRTGEARGISKRLPRRTAPPESELGRPPRHREYHEGSVGLVASDGTRGGQREHEPASERVPLRIEEAP